MRKIHLLVLVLLANILTTHAQEHCSDPTCDNPEDPGLTVEKAFSVYPTPSSGLFTVGLPEVKGEDLTVMVIDASGRLIGRSSVAKGVQKVCVELVGAKPGMHIIRIVNRKGLIFQKIHMII
jgi:hypothetical protein